MSPIGRVVNVVKIIDATSVDTGWTLTSADIARAPSLPVASCVAVRYRHRHITLHHQYHTGV